MIADELGETEELPRAQIAQIVRALLSTQARALLERTREIEAGEGLLVPDGSRRRTLGGVYFYLAYTEGKPKPGKRLRRSFAKKTPEKAAASENATEKQSVAAPSLIVPFTWGERITAISLAADEIGTANVKMTVVGRPGKIVERGNGIVTVMESTSVPALRHLIASSPGPFDEIHGVHCGKAVEEGRGAGIRPGGCAHCRRLPNAGWRLCVIAVFATNTTTKKLQQALKEKQKVESQQA